MNNHDGFSVLSAAAHGATRPVIWPERTDKDRQANRRIVIRIIMYTPVKETLDNYMMVQ